MLVSSTEFFYCGTISAHNIVEGDGYQEFLKSHTKHSWELGRTQLQRTVHKYIKLAVLQEQSKGHVFL